jgi:hypothetical protein
VTFNHDKPPLTATHHRNYGQDKKTSTSQNTYKTFRIPNKIHRQAHNIRIKSALATSKRKEKFDQKKQNPKTLLRLTFPIQLSASDYGTNVSPEQYPMIVQSDRIRILTLRMRAKLRQQQGEMRRPRWYTSKNANRL